MSNVNNNIIGGTMSGASSAAVDSLIEQVRQTLKMQHALRDSEAAPTGTQQDTAPGSSLWVAPGPRIEPK